MTTTLVTVKKASNLVLAFIFIAASLVIVERPLCACTGGVAMGDATSDGRPVVWQNEDMRADPKDNGSYRRAYITKTSKCLILRLHPDGRTWSQVYLYNDGRGRNINNQPGINGYSYGWMYSDGTVDYVELKGDRTQYHYSPLNANRQNDPDFDYKSPNLFVVRANFAFANNDHLDAQSVIARQSQRNGATVRYLTARRLFAEAVNDANKLTLTELLAISRHGNPGVDTNICRPYVKGSPAYSCWGVVLLGVNKGEDPKFATMVVRFGIPDYSIAVPVWADLSAEELSPHVQCSDANDLNSLLMYPFKIFEERFAQDDDKATYDDYINDLFAPVEDNIVPAVTEARNQWLDLGNSQYSHVQMKTMHQFCADAVYATVKSAYETAGNGSGMRNCNKPPEIDEITAENDGLAVTLSCDASDADGLSEFRWAFGDGATATGESNVSHTYTSPGAYQVACFVKDNNAVWKAANVKFRWVSVGG